MEIILLPLAEVRLDSQYLFIDFNVYYLTYLLSLLRVCNFFNAMMKNLFGDSHSSLQVSRACLASSDAIHARLNGPSLVKMLNSRNKKKYFALLVFICTGQHEPFQNDVSLTASTVCDICSGFK